MLTGRALHGLLRHSAAAASSLICGRRGEEWPATGIFPWWSVFRFPGLRGLRFFLEIDGVSGSWPVFLAVGMPGGRIGG